MENFIFLCSELAIKTPKLSNINGRGKEISNKQDIRTTCQNKSYRNSKNNDNIHYLRRLKVVQEDLHNAIEVSKLNYYS